MNESKKCVKCSSTRPLNDFYKYKKSNDGHQSYCKKCQHECVRLHYKNKPKIRKERKPRDFEKFLDKLAGITC